MAVKFTDRLMTSNATPHYALAAEDGGWTASWLPSRTLTHAQAITSMMIAEAVKRLSADEMLSSDDAQWGHFDGWAAELGITGPHAVTEASLTLEDHGMPAAPASEIRDPSEPAALKFTVTMVELGMSTKVMVSAHDTTLHDTPFNVAAYTVPVRGRRPRGDAMGYFAEIVSALNRVIRDNADRPGADRTDPSAAIAHLLTPLPFGAES